MEYLKVILINWTLIIIDSFWMVNFFMARLKFRVIFASRTIPTDFGLVAAAIAGAGSLLFIALRFVPDASN